MYVEKEKKSWGINVVLPKIDLANLASWTLLSIILSEKLQLGKLIIVKRATMINFLQGMKASRQWSKKQKREP